MLQPASVYCCLEESQKPVKIWKKIITNEVNHKQVGFSWGEF